MMIDVASDLHVDKHLAILDWRFLRNGHSNTLILAGDVANNFEQILQEIHKAALEYELVIYVDGNHEHYKSGVSVNDQVRLLQNQLDRYHNVAYLNGNDRCTHRVGNTMFIGGNGWYDWSCFKHEGITVEMAYRSWREGSNDAGWIQWGADDPLIQAMVHSINLSEAVRQAQQDPAVEHIVMVTHTSPRHEVMERRSRDWDIQTPSYVNSLMSGVLREDTHNKIRYWIYGHTHVRNMRVIDGITYINNSRGYAHEERSAWWLPQIEIP